MLRLNNNITPPPDSSTKSSGSIKSFAESSEVKKHQHNSGNIAAKDSKTSNIPSPSIHISSTSTPYITSMSPLSPSRPLSPSPEFDKDKGSAFTGKRFIEPEKYRELLTKLKEKHPMVFSEELTAKPLATGIHKDLVKSLEIPNALVRKFLRIYCNTNRYRKSLQIGAFRYDLCGNATGEVSLAEKSQAKQKGYMGNGESNYDDNGSSSK